MAQLTDRQDRGIHLGLLAVGERRNDKTRTRVVHWTIVPKWADGLRRTFLGRRNQVPTPVEAVSMLEPDRQPRVSKASD